MQTFKSWKYQIDIFENKIDTHNIYITDWVYTNTGIVYGYTYTQEEIDLYIKSHWYAPQLFWFDTGFWLTKTNQNKIKTRLKKLWYQIF